MEKIIRPLLFINALDLFLYQAAAGGFVWRRACSN